ncbi:MAG: AMP-binding protein [Actinomycetota bacterium]|nr:AMP-binding protein [Actinomycetota bacterium]
MNLLELFIDRVNDAEATGRPCLTVPADSGRIATQWTFARLFGEAAAIAAVLQADGAKVGDRVVAQVDKSPEAFALYLACLQAGLVYVPLNTAYTPSEVAFFLSDTDAHTFVCRPGTEASLVEATAATSAVQTLGASGGGTLAERAKAIAPLAGMTDRADDDLACMLYTSGTTGRSKGAMLTHRNLAANGLALHQTWAFGPGDVLLHILPIFHVHGLFVALHCALLNASEVIFCPTFDTTIVRRELQRATVMMGVPTHYTRLLDDPQFGADDCTNVRLFTSGSAPMTEAVFNQFTERTGHRICERYGMTETGILTSNPYDGERTAGTVGYPLPGIELKVLTEDGEPARVGENGMVWVRGEHIGPGYWRLPEKTAEERSTDGFFRTGDVGFLDATGRLTLAGRAGDMIISGGYNVYPKEIELVLDEVPGVVESAVVGLPHPDFGEGVVAFIVGQTTTEVLQAACGQHLARFKHPKHYYFVDELPRNAMGKVQKAQLRADHAAFFAPNED